MATYSKTGIKDLVDQGLITAEGLAVALGNYLSTDEYIEFMDFLVTELEIDVEDEGGSE